MSIVQQNIQYIGQILNQALQNTIYDPDLQTFPQGQQALANTLPQLVQSEVLLSLKESFDTGQTPWTIPEVENIVYATVQGIAFIELSRYGCNFQKWAPAVHYLYNRRQLRGGADMVTMPYQQQYQQPVQQFVQQPMAYQQPVQTYVQTYQQPVQQYIQQPAFGQPGVVSGGAFVTGAPTHSPANNLGVSSLAQTPPNVQGNITMQQQNHMPEVTKPGIYDIQSEAIRVPSQTQETIVQPEVKPPFQKIQLVDKTSLMVTNQGASTACVVYVSVREALSKPVLVATEEERWLPVFNPTDEVTTALQEAVGEELSDTFENLQNLSLRMSINGVLGWMDTRISRIVEMAIRYRYGIPNIDVCHYRDDISAIDQWLESKLGKAAVNDIHCIVNSAIAKMFANIKIESLQEAEEKTVGKYVASVSNDYLLTLPWKISYRYRDNDVAIKGLSTAQIFDIFEQCWDVIDDEDRVSINLVDVAGSRYRAYRIGKPIIGSANWFVEATLV